jgi:hypothetical protein
MDLRISQLKCSVCKCKVDYNDDSVDLAIATCRATGNNCGLKQMNDFMKRMEQKSKGKPKQVPTLLLPHTDSKPRSIEDFEAEQRAACPELYQDGADRMKVVERLGLAANDEPEEILVEDPIYILVDKKGNATTKHVQE